MFAIRALETHTAPMVEDMRNGDLDAARRKASSMGGVEGRGRLDGPHVISCAAETVSENLVDRRPVAMFYFGLAGIPGAVLLGSSTRPTEWSATSQTSIAASAGSPPARTTRALHHARLSVPFIMLSLAILGKDWRAGWRAAMRTTGEIVAQQGLAMAAVAGGLGVRFEKQGHYSMGKEMYRTIRPSYSIPSG